MTYQVKRLFEIIFIFGAFLAFSLVMIGIGAYFYFSPIIANKSSLMNNNNTGLTLLDREGNPFFTFYEAKSGDYVKLSEISDFAEKAAVAVEDKEFYSHNGISIKGILRSVLYNLEQQDMAYGGSTITQQLVKNTLLSPEKSVVRKLKEAVLAQEVERRYSKDEILEMYLNSVYFGKGAFGIEQAAEAYFGKSADKLSLSEASFLIGILPSPSNAESEEGLVRQKYVLQQLHKNGDITEEELRSALESKLVFSESTADINVLAPHFAVMVRDQLAEKYGEEVIIRSGFRVQTTLDPEWQLYAEDTVKRNVANLAGNNVTNGAAVVMIPGTGEVRALVGSVDWYDSRVGKVNMATSPRQPGSSFKPFVYGIALEGGSITPATVLRDTPTTIKMVDCQVNCTYKPQNYDGRFRGPVLVRRALANSLNIPAVQVMQRVGVQPVLDKAQELGIESLKDASNYGPSLVLGAGEVPLVDMTQAYGAFANYGELVKAKTYTQIVNKSGKVIEANREERKRVWSESVAFIISSILSDTRARAEMFGSALNISRPAAVKTGTTDDYRDAWTIGYTPDLLVGVWVGNNYNEPMDRIAGSLGAAPIWRQLMEQFSRGMVVKNFEAPDSVVRLAICGGTESATGSAKFEYFVEGTQAGKSCYSAPRNNVARDTQPTPTGFQPGVGGAAPTEPPTPTPVPQVNNEETEPKNENVQVEVISENKEDNKKDEEKND